MQNVLSEMWKSVGFWFQRLSRKQQSMLYALSEQWQKIEWLCETTFKQDRFAWAGDRWQNPNLNTDELSLVFDKRRT